ncbi:MAG: alpha-L-arabinofuranosidase C-terminal domain-containing protein [bacterium]|nr:alpha-L-arabinofuranosidase C-terminal domain-containing protein [bacterium]
MAKITLNPARSKGTINKNIYGHFSEHLGRCIYQGFFVGKDSQIPNVNGMRTAAVEAMKHIKAPVLRWPGGCFADEYHWEDGIGPQEQRKRMVNTNWGYVVEDNSFGTHEFLELCDQIGCEPYINANVGSGTVREMAEWVEYLNSEGDSTVVRKRWENGRKEPFNVRYWGVGNESWGCGGNMRPEYYADEFRRYQTFCRNYGDNKLYRIACGPNVADYNWTDVLMERAGKFMDALTLHYYTLCGDEWAHKGAATGFSKSDFYKTLVRASRMKELVENHSKIMDKHDPEKRVGLIVDEWGAWYDVEEGTNPGFLYQQNSMRDALIAAITLNIFNQNCDRVVMANLAQTVNVLQAVILTEGDKLVLTPTYHVFDLYKNHQDAREVDCFVESGMVGEDQWQIGKITASASEKDGVITLTVANLSADEGETITLEGVCAKEACGRIVKGEMGQYNDFDASPIAVEAFDGVKVEDGKVTITLPACCVASIELR